MCFRSVALVAWMVLAPACEGSISMWEEPKDCLQDCQPYEDGSVKEPAAFDESGPMEKERLAEAESDGGTLPDVQPESVPGEDGGATEEHQVEDDISFEEIRPDEAALDPDGFQGDFNESEDSDPGLPQLQKAIDISVWSQTISDPDIDCLWADGYRHLIAGTQLPEVTRQQILIAIRGGMTVDLYIYLFWDLPIQDQVQDAIELMEEFPVIHRVWIDIEQDPVGRTANQLMAMIREAVDGLNGRLLGIYTTTGFWKSYLENRPSFSEWPLWYAHYDGVADFSDWFNPNDDYYRFGAWTDPLGKQFASDELPPGVIRPCGICADQNIMWIDFLPTVVVDRSIPPDDGTPPDAPSALHPDNGFQISTSYVGLTAPAVRESTNYDIQIQFWSSISQQWMNYLTPTNLPTSAYKFSPSASVQDRAFRWRIRGSNGNGDGVWSNWAWFRFGNVQDLPPLK